jgi:hypothetical protein
MEDWIMEKITKLSSRITRPGGRIIPESEWQHGHITSITGDPDTDFQTITLQPTGLFNDVDWGSSSVTFFMENLDAQKIKDLFTQPEGESIYFTTKKCPEGEFIDYFKSYKEDLEKTKAIEKLEHLLEEIERICLDTLIENKKVLAGDVFATLERFKWRWLRDHIESRIESRIKKTFGIELMTEESKETSKIKELKHFDYTDPL